MENISIQATERAPEIQFDFGSNTYLIKGESYPEDVNEFFGPIVENLESHLEGNAPAEILFTFELIYFNSSTAKVLMGLFDTLDEYAENDKKVKIVWRFEEDDDNMQELGEEYGEDLENADFVLETISID